MQVRCNIILYDNRYHNFEKQICKYYDRNLKRRIMFDYSNIDIITLKIIVITKNYSDM